LNCNEHLNYFALERRQEILLGGQYNITMAPPFVTSVTRAAVSAAFAVTSSSSSLRKLREQQQPLASRIFNLETPALSSTSTSSSTVVDLAEMCRLFGIAGPRGKLESINSCLCLYDEASSNSSNDNSSSNRRGLYYIDQPSIQKGDVILSIPLTSCLRDDNPPSWYYGTTTDDEEEEGEENSSTDWFTRLAAQVLDILDPSATSSSPATCGWEMWHNSLPNSHILHSSLPVHWSSTVIAYTQCTDIDIMVDTQYFVREAAISRLVKTRYSPTAAEVEEDNDGDGVIQQQQLLTRKCHDALDIVQTRSCRVERKLFGDDDGDDDDNVPPRVWGPPIRIIAPVFDFINHGGSGSSSNACFGLEDNVNGNNNNNNILINDLSRWLVVRATRTINKGDEILIDYGDSARPQWKCLTSYGFVPSLSRLSSTVNYKEEEEEENENTDNEAELWMHGRRFMVNSLSVPYELVELATAQAVLDDEINILDDSDDDIDDITYDTINNNIDETGDKDSLAPSILRAIAKRAKETAYNLILESTTEITNDDNDKNQEKKVWNKPDFQRAMSLASELRWSQHNVLLAFADNLISYLNLTSS
jgi:hypothetical protein